MSISTDHSYPAPWKISTEQTAMGNECVRIDNSVMFWIGHHTGNLFPGLGWPGRDFTREQVELLLPYLRSYAATGSFKSADKFKEPSQ